MPYKEGKRWRGVVKRQGERYTTVKDSKKEAIAWENETRKKLKKAEQRQQEGLDLLSFCSKYLIYSERYSEKTYKEKKKLCKTILELWGPDKPVNKITPDDIQTYLDEQSKIRSANASNKDRKNLLAMWNYGVKILDLNSNPVNKTDKRPHDVSSQLTYTEEEIIRLLNVTSREEKLILTVFLETAGRRKEVFRIKVDDINIEKQIIRLWTRKTRDGSKEGEWLPMSNDLSKELSWWLENRPLKESIWLFPNEKTNMP